MSDAWEFLASVRYGESGYDVVRARDGRVLTRRFIPGGACMGHHDEPQALQLLADLARLSSENYEKVRGLGS